MAHDAAHPQGDTIKPQRRWIVPRVVGILLALVAAICASVVVTNRLSPRDRRASAQTAPAVGRAP